MNANQISGGKLLDQVHVAVEANLPKQRFSGQQALCYERVKRDKNDWEQGNSKK